MTPSILPYVGTLTSWDAELRAYRTSLRTLTGLRLHNETAMLDGADEGMYAKQGSSTHQGHLSMEKWGINSSRC